MKNILLSPASFGLTASLFCGVATILFGCFWFLSAASQDVKIVNQPASEGRPITPAGWWACDGIKSKTRRKSVWKGGVTQNHGGL